MKRLIQISLIAALVGWSTSAIALSESEATFVVDAIRVGMTDAEIGRIASDKGGSPEVRAFAERMRHDQMALTSALKALAAREGLAADVPEKVDSEKVGKIENIELATFDQKFVSEVIQDHTSNIQKLERQQETSTTPGLRELLEDALPTLRQHLQQAERVRQQLK